MVSFRSVAFLIIIYSIADYRLRFVSGCIVAPKICPSKNIKYYLYTSANPSLPVELNTYSPESFKGIHFLQAPIKFIIHGYTGHRDGFVNTELRSAYFKKSENVNVLVIDFGELAQENCYVQAVLNTDVIAKCTAEFLESLFRIRPDIELAQFHFIAFSMGAHIAGRISTYLRKGQIERISALDAAFPGYVVSTRPIQQGDAKFIDVLHTNGGLRGKPLPFGDIDFYANGGTFQPHCAALNTTCSHVFSIILFAESIISSVGFWAHSCSVYSHALGYCPKSDHPPVLFGEYVDHSARGTYFFKTTDTVPYTLTKNYGIF